MATTIHHPSSKSCSSNASTSLRYDCFYLINIILNKEINSIKYLGSWPAGVTTTTKRPVWPPPLPTHPPSGGQTTTKFPTTTTTAYPVHDEHTGNYCGSKNGNQDQERIVGGHEAALNEWPWIAALLNNGRQFCGGNIIIK